MKGIAAVTGAKKLKLKSMLIFIAAFIMAILLAFLYISQMFKPMAVSAETSEIVRVEIPKGSSVSQIGKILADKGLIRNQMVFKAVTKLKGYESRYMAGTYIMNDNMDIYEIMEEMINGRVYTETVRFTIPEGFEVRQTADLLEQMGVVSREDFLREVNEGTFNFGFLQNVPSRDNRLEGYLFPDTYEVYVGESARSIIQRMLKRFEEVAEETGLLEWKSDKFTLDDIVILASIIEREAANNSERPLVSAVFHNRLRMGKKLESCATVQYVLKERKARLTYDDLEIESPYNTYKVQGLPVGPIASPGAESLRAAMNPAEVDFLYFVLQKDGTHSFSRNYEEFLEDKRESKR
ncbi:MAG: protein YceG like [Firmicutes bacterium]|nr:protein YceG like [Bacillota bacterium]MDI6706787.1 endolytic transglycosylase MltG [Bacillota bacterium]